MVTTLLMLCYKYHFSLSEVLSFTMPQIELVKSNLELFCKMENGQEDKVNKEEDNTKVFDETLKVLQRTTGRSSFTLEEVMNPAETLKKYKKV